MQRLNANIFSAGLTSCQWGMPFFPISTDVKFILQFRSQPKEAGEFTQTYKQVFVYTLLMRTS